jgi:hypothetical protein
VPDLPDDLRTALAAVLAGPARSAPWAGMGECADRLIARYRDDRPADEPILRDDADVAAYAGYRMPATFAAARAACAAAAAAAPRFRPASQLDLGGGTGAAVWAAAATWETLATARVWEQSPHASGLGRALARHAVATAVRAATWEPADLSAASTLPPADLVTMSRRRRNGGPDRRARHTRRLHPHPRGAGPADRARPAGPGTVPARPRLPHPCGYGLVSFRRPAGT